MRPIKYDDQGKKWLIVRTWKKYQPPSNKMSKNGRYKWIRDHVSKLDDYDYQQLSGLERSIFAGVCQLVATRPKRSVPNDPLWIAHALHLVRGDIPHTGRALTNIIARQFLVRSEVEENNCDDVFEEEVEDATAPTQHPHDPFTAPAQHQHGTTTTPSRHQHGTVTAPAQHQENVSIDGTFSEEMRKKRGIELEG